MTTKSLDNDIYNSEETYLNIVNNPESLLIEAKKGVGNKNRYYIKNKNNLTYFQKLISHFESKNLSYVRRLRVIRNYKLLCYATDKDLKEVTRDDIDKIMAVMHQSYKSPNSKADFIKDLKYIWKLILPEKDPQGRADETLVPYVVRHLSSKIDKSKNKLRNDRLTPEELEKIINYFSQDPRLQAYIMIAFESLGRPQEILWRRIKDLEINDNYAKIWISDHAKEDLGFLQIIDSYPYLVKLLNNHPLRNDPEAFIFLNQGNNSNLTQMRPENINKHLKLALKELKIYKNITCYSIKRNGVTFRKVRGDDDVNIQHAARWSSTSQVKTYDYTHQEDALKIELVKRGLIKPDEGFEKYSPKTKNCIFCGHKNAFNDVNCNNCKRPLDRTMILQQEENKNKELETLKNQMSEINKKLGLIERYEKLTKQKK